MQVLQIKKEEEEKKKKEEEEERARLEREREQLRKNKERELRLKARQDEEVRQHFSSRKAFNLHSAASWKGSRLNYCSMLSSKCSATELSAGNGCGATQWWLTLSCWPCTGTAAAASGRAAKEAGWH